MITGAGGGGRRLSILVLLICLWGVVVAWGIGLQSFEALTGSRWDLATHINFGIGSFLRILWRFSLQRLFIILLTLIATKLIFNNVGFRMVAVAAHTFLGDGDAEGFAVFFYNVHRLQKVGNPCRAPTLPILLCQFTQLLLLKKSYHQIRWRNFLVFWHVRCFHIFCLLGF